MQKLGSIWLRGHVENNDASQKNLPIRVIYLSLQAKSRFLHYNSPRTTGTGIPDTGYYCVLKAQSKNTEDFFLPLCHTFASLFLTWL